MSSGKPRKDIETSQQREKASHRWPKEERNRRKTRPGVDDVPVSSGAFPSRQSIPRDVLLLSQAKTAKGKAENASCSRARSSHRRGWFPPPGCTPRSPTRRETRRWIHGKTNENGFRVEEPRQFLTMNGKTSARGSERLADLADELHCRFSLKVNRTWSRSYGVSGKFAHSKRLRYSPSNLELQEFRTVLDEIKIWKKKYQARRQSLKYWFCIILMFQY